MVLSNIGENMEHIADKSDNQSGEVGTLPAAEWNDKNDEIETCVTSSGQTLALNKSPNQFSKALSIYAVGAGSFQDSGSANAIILTPVTGASGLIMGDAYSQLNGAIVTFYKFVANTSTTVTVNIGQTNGLLLGAKPLVMPGGGAPDIGTLVGFLKIQYFISVNEWVVVVDGLSYSLIYNETTNRTNADLAEVTNRNNAITTVAPWVQCIRMTGVLSGVGNDTEIVMPTNFNTNNSFILSVAINKSGANWIYGNNDSPYNFSYEITTISFISNIIISVNTNSLWGQAYSLFLVRIS
jgi:hypothetical protein